MIEVNGAMRATVERTFWRRREREDFARLLQMMGWTLELAADVPVPFTRGRLQRYRVELIAPSYEARRQAQAIALQRLAHPSVPFVVTPTVTRPPMPAFMQEQQP